MPSIYPQLTSSDRTFIRREKARIRRQFLDLKKQEEMIDALYKKMLRQDVAAEVVKKEEKAEVKPKAPKAKVSAKKAVKAAVKAKA